MDVQASIGIFMSVVRGYVVHVCVQTCTQLCSSSVMAIFAEETMLSWITPTRAIIHIPHWLLPSCSFLICPTHTPPRPQQPVQAFKQCRIGCGLVAHALIPAPGRQRQAELWEFKASLVFGASSRTAGAMEKPSIEKEKKKLKIK